MLTDRENVNPLCRYLRGHVPIIGIHRAVPNKRSTFNSFPYTQSHSSNHSLVCLPRTCTFSQFNNHAKCLGRITLVESLNQEISLHQWLLCPFGYWQLNCFNQNTTEQGALCCQHEHMCLGNQWLSAAPKETNSHCIFLTIYVIHLAGDEIPSLVHIFPPKKTSPLWRRCQTSWLSM